MEAVIIRLTPYQEKDYIVNALTVKGFLSFRVRGALNVKSKFAGKLFLYALVDIEVTEGVAGFTLSNIETLNNMAKIFTDYNKIIVLNLIGEIIQRTIKDEDSVIETFTLIRNALHGLPNTSNLLSLCYLFITSLARQLGFGLVVDRCVSCGSKENIIGIDYRRGGLICADCNTGNTQRLDAAQIKTVRYGFMINETQLFRHEFSDEEIRPLLKRMIQYIEEIYDFKIISNDLLN